MAGKYEFKVNGVQIATDEQFLTANEILKLAQEKGAIPGEPSNYILKGSKQDYQGEDNVDLAEDDLFLTVPTTSTQVAELIS